LIRKVKQAFWLQDSISSLRKIMIYNIKKKGGGDVFLCQSIDSRLQGKKEIGNNRWKEKLEKIK